MSSTLEENSVFESDYSGLETLDLVRAMGNLQTIKDALEAELSALNKRYDYVRFVAVPSRFDAEGIVNMKVEGLGRVQLASDLYASIKSDKKEEAYQWLSDTGHGGAIQPSIHPSTFKAMIKAMMLNGEEIPEDMFTVTPFTRASIVRKV